MACRLRGGTKVLLFRYWDCSLPGQEGAEEELDAAQGVAYNTFRRLDSS